MDCQGPREDKTISQGKTATEGLLLQCGKTALEVLLLQQPLQLAQEVEASYSNCCKSGLAASVTLAAGDQ